MGMVTILDLWPKLFEKTYVPTSQGHSRWNLASVGLVFIAVNKLKNIESERFGPRLVNDLDFWHS